MSKNISWQEYAEDMYIEQAEFIIDTRSLQAAAVQFTPVNDSSPQEGEEFTLLLASGNLETVYVKQIVSAYHIFGATKFLFYTHVDHALELQPQKIWGVGIYLSEIKTGFVIHI